MVSKRPIKQTSIKHMERYRLIKTFQDISDIYCINLKKRSDRKNQCIDIFKSININNYNFIEAKDGASIFPNKHKKIAARIGCTLSHIDAIQNFKKTKNQYGLILEDDFMCDHSMITKFNEYCDQVPEDFCILYLGANHKAPTAQYSKNLNRCVKSHCAHAYIINKEYIDKILNNKYMDFPVIDVYFSDFIQQKYPCYCFNPKLVWQRESYSDIEGRNVFYQRLK